MLNRAQFLDALAAWMRAQPDFHEVVKEPEHFMVSVRVGDGLDIKIGAGAVFRNYWHLAQQQNGEVDLGPLFAGYVGSIVGDFGTGNNDPLLLTDYDAVRPSLRLRIDRQDRWDSLPALAGELRREVPVIISRPWHFNLVELPVFDMPRSMRPVLASDLARWGRMADDVWRDARANTRAFLRDPEMRPDTAKGVPFAVIRNETGYASSAALFPEYLRGLFPQIERLAVGLPTRDLLVVGRAQPEALAMMRLYMLDQSDDIYPLLDCSTFVELTRKGYTGNGFRIQ